MTERAGIEKDVDAVDVDEGMKRKRWFGRTLIGWAWADDGKWDWTSDRGDHHSDFASIAVCRRDGYQPLYRVTLGPLCVSFVRVKP